MATVTKTFEVVPVPFTRAGDTFIPYGEDRDNLPLTFIPMGYHPGCFKDGSGNVARMANGTDEELIVCLKCRRSTTVPKGIQTYGDLRKALAHLCKDQVPA